MKIKFSEIKNWLLLLFLFILPWQTRSIYQTANIGKDFWEYGSLSLYGTEILLGIIILLFLVEKIRNNFSNLFIKHFDKKRLIKILLSFLGILSLYLFTGANRAVTWQYLNWLISGVCLIFIILQSRLNFQKLSLAIWGGGVLQAILGIWQFFIQYIPANKWLGMAVQDPYQLGVAVVEVGDERWLRAYGAFGWPNSLGIYLATVFLLGVMLICQNENRKIKTLLLVGQVMILLGLFFSFARGAWLALIVGLLVLIIKKNTGKLFWQQIGVYALIVLVLLVIFKPLIFSRFDFNNRLEKMSLSQRTNQLTEFRQVFSKNYLVGVGPGNYIIALHDLYPKYSAGDLKPVHNIFLLFVAEWGLIGIFLLGYLLFFIRKKINWLFPPLLVILFAGLFDHWSVSMFTGLIFFCLMVDLSVKYVDVDTKVQPE